MFGEWGYKDRVINKYLIWVDNTQRYLFINKTGNFISRSNGVEFRERFFHRKSLNGCRIWSKESCKLEKTS